MLELILLRMYINPSRDTASQQPIYLFYFILNFLIERRWNTVQQRGTNNETEGALSSIYGFGSISRRQSCKPIIAAVIGGAYGGGVEMILNCDLVIASQDAKFALPEVKRGVVAAQGGKYFSCIFFYLFTKKFSPFFYYFYLIYYSFLTGRSFFNRNSPTLADSGTPGKIFFYRDRLIEQLNCHYYVPFFF